MNINLIFICGLIFFILLLINKNTTTETFIEDREDGHTYIVPNTKNKNVNISADKDINLTSNQNIFKSNNNQLTGKQLSSHIPYLDGNTYIRPGEKGKNINIENAGSINLGSTQGLFSHIPYVDGNTYIRPGKKGNAINIDHASSINLGSTHGLSSHIPYVDGNTYIRPGKKGNAINIDHAGSINLGSVDGLVSHLPHSNKHTYIRPGKRGHNIYISEAAGIHHASTNGHWSHLPHENGHTYLRPGKHNHNIYIDHANHIGLGANNVALTNGRIMAHSNGHFCIDGQCLNGTEIKKLRQLLQQHTLDRRYVHAKQPNTPHHRWALIKEGPHLVLRNLDAGRDNRWHIAAHSYY